MTNWHWEEENFIGVTVPEISDPPYFISHARCGVLFDCMQQISRPTPGQYPWVTMKTIAR